MTTENDKDNASLKDKLLRDINAGHVAMHSKMHFALKMTAIILSVVAIVIVAVFLSNILFYSIRFNHHQALLGFGPRGWQSFIRFFPWLFLLVGVALVAVLEYLLRRFRFGYKVPVLYLLGGLLAVTLVAGVSLDHASLNERLYEREDRLPSPVHRLYDRARNILPPGKGICRCTISAIEGNELLVQDERLGSTTLRVLLPEDDSRATTTGLKAGDTVFIAGVQDDGVIRAFGVKKETEFRLPR